MTFLNETIIHFFQDQGCVLLTTIGKDGLPHASCKGIVRIDENGLIYLLDAYVKKCPVWYTIPLKYRGEESYRPRIYTNKRMPALHSPKVRDLIRGWLSSYLISDIKRSFVSLSQFVPSAHLSKVSSQKTP